LWPGCLWLYHCLPPKLKSLSLPASELQDKPTTIELIIYFGYWVIVLLIAGFKWYSGSLFDADYKYKRMMAKKQREAEAARRDSSALGGIEVLGGAGSSVNLEHKTAGLADKAKSGSSGGESDGVGASAVDGSKILLKEAEFQAPPRRGVD
jgi:hypothetical protein